MCPECEATFTTRDHKAKYCSQHCRAVAVGAVRSHQLFLASLKTCEHGHVFTGSACPVCRDIRREADREYNARPEVIAVRAEIARLKAQIARAERLEEQPVRTCVRCMKEFRSMQPVARFCSKHCYKAHHRNQGPAEHHRRLYRGKVRALRASIIERDGWRCYLCGRPIPEDVPVLDPDALTLDHVKPWSQGGSDEASNLRPAHRECNREKGDRLLMSWELARLATTGIVQ